MTDLSDDPTFDWRVVADHHAREDGFCCRCWPLSAEKSRQRERDRQVRVLEPLGSFCFAIGKRHIMARQSASRCRGSRAETHTQVVGVAFVVTLPLALGYSVPPVCFDQSLLRLL
jgi:hypothetical protein